MQNGDLRINDESEVDVEKGESLVNVKAEAWSDGVSEVVGTDGSASEMATVVVSEFDSVGDRNDSRVSSCVNNLSVSERAISGNADTLVTPLPTIVVSGNGVSSGNDESSVVLSPKKAQLSRDSSAHEQCRVCQQDKDEDLINLGCQCRGDLGKTHRSCIDTWFRTKGSNRCEICHWHMLGASTRGYGVWRVDRAFGGGNNSQERQRGGFSPLWVAFSILIGGLLLDILMSITLGVSALPVNIIIGVIVVLGIGTALRLTIEFFRDWNVSRIVQRTDPNVHFGYNTPM